MSELPANHFVLKQTPGQKLNAIGIELEEISDEAANHEDFANAIRMLDLAEVAFKEAKVLIKGEI